MSRRPLRAVKICQHCKGGFDAFRAMEVRGRYCSPECLAAARAESRRSRDEIEDTGVASGI